MHDSPRRELLVFYKTQHRWGCPAARHFAPARSFLMPVGGWLATVEAAGVWPVLCAPKAEETYAWAETWERGAIVRHETLLPSGGASSGRDLYNSDSVPDHTIQVADAAHFAGGGHR
jgi:hypothetical protein